MPDFPSIKCDRTEFGTTADVSESLASSQLLIGGGSSGVPDRRYVFSSSKLSVRVFVIKISARDCTRLWISLLDATEIFRALGRSFLGHV